MRIAGIIIHNGSDDGIHVNNDDIREKLIELYRNNSRTGHEPDDRFLSNANKLQYYCQNNDYDNVSDLLFAFNGFNITLSWLMEAGD